VSDPERRVEDLEVKVAFLEHALGELDEVVRGLFDKVEALQAEVKRLRDAQQAGEEGDDDEGGLAYEKPPHY